LHYFQQRRVLQAIVAVLGLIPISAGFAGIIAGPLMIVSASADISLDSHFRYLSGLLLALGLGFWSAIPSIEKKTTHFQLLTFVVFVGGLGRLASLIFIGTPSPPMIFGLIMELIVTPLVCFWQNRLARVRKNQT
jgi:hypothetical protein